MIAKASVFEPNSSLESHFATDFKKYNLPTFKNKP